MQTVKIGILDEEKEYVEALAAYLGRYARGRWTIAAFTDLEVLYSYLQSRKIDILTGTNRGQLEKVQREYEGLYFLWLSEEKRELDNVFEGGTEAMAAKSVYRYQSAKVIAMTIQNIVEQRYGTLKQESKMVGIYSPVGRCGKTTLALEVSQKEEYGKWIYVGMEDYSSFLAVEYGEEENKTMSIGRDANGIGAPDITMEEFLYYVKERQGRKLSALMEQSGGMIASGRLLFDTRQITKEDLLWVRQILQQSSFAGVVFDIGTGVLQDYELFSVFDCLLVPYLPEKTALVKKQNFERGIKLLEVEGIEEKIRFLNMENRQEREEVMREIFK